MRDREAAMQVRLAHRRNFNSSKQRSAKWLNRSKTESVRSAVSDNLPLAQFENSVEFSIAGVAPSCYPLANKRRT
jgi:hypothetical protein